uniref:PiggyBac transposable element derived 5 n=1 Tax=Leptobrachium leishanense TaxID=445787 RepID=A0A8C5N1A9_9ANUR
MMVCESPAGGGSRKKMSLSLLEAARSRYESLQISDDLFGESGDDSSGNPFYSTSPDSRSSASGCSSEEEQGDPQTGGQGDGRGEPGEGDPAARPGAEFKVPQGRSKRRARGEDVQPAAGIEKGTSGSRRERSCREASQPGPGHELSQEEQEEGWSHTLHHVPTPSFKESSGPTRKLPPDSSVMDFFQLFVPDNVLKNMVTQTNMYAKKFQERFGSDDAWMDVTLEEMKSFLGYMISTSTQHCESVLSIWSGGFYSNKSISLIMTQTRFEKILKYFHIVAFRSSQTTHGLYKIQPFLDALQNGFDSTFRPSQTQIYVHLKEGSGMDGLGTLKIKPQLHSMVAKSLCQNSAGKNYIIFTGPSITSLNLFEEFEKQDIYCCGLLSSRKSDCTGLPLSMMNNPDVPQSRGQYGIRMKGNMSLICWYNRGHFRFLTNAYSPVQQGVIIKRKSGEIPCPLAVEAFAAHLSYICKYDDKYSKYFISHKPNKTWQQVFWFAISIAINNAYILYKMSDAYQVKRYSRAQFGDRLVRELLGLEETSPCH